MLLLWVTLLVLHQGYTLVPVTTVPLGESATFTCALPIIEYSFKQLYWFKQNAGETLTLIVTLVEFTKPEFAPEFSDSRLELKRNNNLSNLTIRRTNPEDEGMYHCLIRARFGNPLWSGTYLLLKGNTQRTSNYSVQWPTLSDPAPPGNSMTLQCSVLSKSETKTCQGDISVFWFRAGSDKSRPSFIYTDGRGQEECEKLPDTQKSCFSKNFNSADAGTYYCAVATCGEIFFGDVTKLKTEDSLCNLQTYNIYLLCGISAISLIVISVLIHAIKKSKCECDHNKDAVSLQDYVAKMNAKRNDDQWIYSTVIYTVMKTSIGGTRDKKASKRERIYAAAKAF